MKDGQRAGLVGTNTIRQNYSRMGGLDHIVENGGVITEAVSSMMWPGDAALHVSIVNWIKGTDRGEKRLYVHEGTNVETGWRYDDLDRIPASLSFDLDVTGAKTLKLNAKAGLCFQGQTHGHKSFLIKASDALLLIGREQKYKKVLKPFLTAEELIGAVNSKAKRYVIDFTGMDLLEAQQFPKALKPIETHTLPDRQKAADIEASRNAKLLKINPSARVDRHHANFLKKWWEMSYPREDMFGAINPLPRFIVCGQVTKRPIFEFLSYSVNPNAALVVFAHADDYTFGILQSSLHWIWFVNRCSTLTERYRYTSNTVFDSFPWPQAPTLAQIKAVSQAAVALRKRRRELCEKHGLSLRDLYRSVEKPGSHPLKDEAVALDVAVRKAYGMTPKEEPLAFLLKLNLELAAKEQKGLAIVGPGLPTFVTGRDGFTSDDSVTP